MLVVSSQPVAGAQTHTWMSLMTSNIKTEDPCNTKVICSSVIINYCAAIYWCSAAISKGYRQPLIFQYIYHIKPSLAHFQAYKILESSTTTGSHFIRTSLTIFQYKKSEHRFFIKVLRTWTISERHVIERHLSDNWHIKSCFILSAIGYVISHEGGIHYFSLQ